MLFFGSWLRQFVPGDSPTKIKVKLKIIERRLRRQQQKNERKEKKLLKKIKKLLAKGETERARTEAGIIVTNRKYSRNFLKMASRIRHVRLKFQQAVEIQALGENMMGITDCLKEMNKANDLDEMDTVMTNLELQMGEFELKEEALEESLDIVSYVEDEEETVDDIIQMVSAADLAEKMKGLETVEVEEAKVSIKKKIKDDKLSTD